MRLRGWNLRVPILPAGQQGSHSELNLLLNTLKENLYLPEGLKPDWQSPWSVLLSYRTRRFDWGKIMESILLILQLLQFLFFLCQFRGNYKPKKKNPIYRLESFQVILVPGRCDWASEGNLKVENLHTVLKKKKKTFLTHFSFKREDLQINFCTVLNQWFTFEHMDAWIRLSIVTVEFWPHDKLQSWFISRSFGYINKGICFCVVYNSKKFKCPYYPSIGS